MSLASKCMLPVANSLLCAYAPEAATSNTPATTKRTLCMIFPLVNSLNVRSIRPSVARENYTVLSKTAFSSSAAGHLVHGDPVIADPGHFFRKTLEVHRLHQVAVDAEVVAAHEVRLFLARCQHHDRDGPGAAVCLDTLQYLDAIDLRHLD